MLSQKWCGSPWLMLLLPVKDMETTFALASMSADSQLRKRDIEGFCDNPYPPPCKKYKSLNRRLSKRTLKNCDKNAEVYSTLNSFWQVSWWERTHFSLRSCPPCSSEYVGNTKLASSSYSSVFLLKGWEVPRKTGKWRFVVWNSQIIKILCKDHQKTFTL